MDSTGQVRWRRAGYPSQATSGGSIPSTQKHLAPSPLPQNHGSPPGQHEEIKQSSNGPPAWYHAVTDTQMSPIVTKLELAIDNSLSSLHPVDEVPSTDDSSTAVSISHRSASPSFSRGHTSSPEDKGKILYLPEPTKNTQYESSLGQKQWARNKYPLQAPTEITNTRSPSPPSPQEGSEQSSPPASAPEPNVNVKVKRTLRRTPRSRRIQLRASNPQESYRRSIDTNRSSSSTESIHKDELLTSPTSNPWRRQPYPLQSPTSGSTPLDWSHSSQDYEMESASNALSPDQHEQSEPSSPEISSWRRRAYPLQWPKHTSTTLPASPPSSDTELERAPETSSRQSQETGQTESAKKLWQRRGYPLQHPASHANLRHSPTPPPSPKKELKIAAQLSPNQTQRGFENGQNVVKSDRQAYPSQSFAGLPKLHISSPTDEAPVVTMAKQEPKGLSVQFRNYELASKVINHWRRQLYPVHSPRRVEPFRRVPSPQPPEERSERKPEQIHLPRNIKAVKDSHDHTPKGRTIIVCLDGTGDKFDHDNSNIVHLISSLKKDDPNQVTYYQAGIGTYNTGGLSWGFAAAADMAVGSGLGLHVRDAYHFLMHTYKEGDKICIFGFSRGAYTARCVAGMIHKVGLLPPRNLQQIPFAYEFYANDTPEGWKESFEFKKTFSIDVNVYFLGCFDSVASVGFIPRQLPLSTTPNNKPHYFRHAMALDERRAKFKICRHQAKHWKDIQGRGASTDIVTKSTVSQIIDWFPNHKAQNDVPPESSASPRYGKHHHPNVTDEEYAQLTGHDAPFETDVLEVWFTGAHADVGGGAVPNDERHKLAQIPLRWMIRQAFECNTGIIFKTKVLAEFGLDVHTLWPKYRKLSVPTHLPAPSYLDKYDQGLPPKHVRREKLVSIQRFEKGEHFYELKGHEDEDWTPEQIEDFYDAMTPVNDQLEQAPTWWILEAWPVQYKVPKAPGEVIIRTGMNLGRYRGVEEAEPKVHWTALQRAQHMGYKIRVRTAAHTTWRAVV